MENVKRLKFSAPFPKRILDGLEDTTWRINDEKNIAVGDVLSLCGNDGVEFAKARVVEVGETSFGSISDEMLEHNSEFGTKEELYLGYSRYYGIPIGDDTQLKVIKFRLLSGR